jgi:hypothetical protein
MTASHIGRLTPGQTATGNYWTASLVRPTAYLNVMEKSSLSLSEFETWNVQLVPSSCTYYAIPAFYAFQTYFSKTKHYVTVTTDIMVKSRIRVQLVNTTKLNSSSESTAKNMSPNIE